MKQGLYFIALLLMLLYACHNQAKRKNTGAAKNSTGQTVSKKEVMAADQPFSIFRNIEMVEYCVPVPGGYGEDYTTGLQKGGHIFIDTGKKDNRIEVQGLIRSDNSVSLPEYFNNTYNDAAEAEGMIITEKQLLREENCFYAKGYWNNQYYNTRFLEITWLRADELVTYKVAMNVNDTSFWDRHLHEIINTKAMCE